MNSVRPMCLPFLDGHRSGRLDFHQHGHRGLPVAQQACLLRASSVSEKSHRVREGVYINTNCSGQLPAHFVVLGQYIICEYINAHTFTCTPVYI
jgi:hypothetical protein